MVRPTYVEVDLAAISNNVSAFRELIAPSSFCAVVKADAYGHGDVPVALAALESGAEMLAVALVEEGARLREAGVDAPILLLSEPDPEAAIDLARWELIPTVYTPAFVDALVATGEASVPHLKIDTGMHRVGAQPVDVEGLVDAIRHAENLDLGAVWTHFAVADEDPAFTESQIELFDNTVADLDVPMQHLCNTPGAILFPGARRDMCRIGLGLYGLHPTTETVDQIDLRPAMRLVSHVTHVQKRSVGDRPSYGRVRPLSYESTVVTIPVGYADGFSRLLTDHGAVLIGGQRFPLAGRVTMDQIVVDVGDTDVRVGDEVVLLGSQNGSEIPAEEWAESLGTISYEVVTSIGPRVPRRHI